LPKVFTAKRTNTIEANRILIEAKQQQKPAKLALSPALYTPPKKRELSKEISKCNSNNNFCTAEEKQQMQQQQQLPAL